MKAIQTKYLSPTNARGGRIKAFDDDGNNVTISYPYELNQEEAHRSAAVALMRKMGWTGRLQAGWTKKGYVFVFVGESLPDYIKF